MTDDKKDKPDLRIELSPQVEAKMAEDPKLAAALRDMFASMRQANQAVELGQYKTFEDAMEAITGNRPERITKGDEDGEEDEEDEEDAAQ